MAERLTAVENVCIQMYDVIGYLTVLLHYGSLLKMLCFSFLRTLPRTATVCQQWSSPNRSWVSMDLMQLLVENTEEKPKHYILFFPPLEDLALYFHISLSHKVIVVVFRLDESTD